MSDTNAPAAVATKAAPDVETVTMTDARVVDFTGKQKIKKEGLQAEDGSLAIRVDFRNGETRTYKLNATLLPDYALHGALQKFGDEVSGLKGTDGAAATVDDMVQAMDELDQRVNVGGKWNAEREGGTGAVAGGSELARAMAVVTSKTPADVTVMLASLDAKTKASLRKEPRIAAAILKLKEEALAKITPAASEAAASLLDGFMTPA